MFETAYEGASTFAIFLLCLVIALFIMYPQVKEVPLEVVKEVPVEVTKVVEIKGDCPPCTTTIERVIEKPCPEKKCICTARGGYADNQTGGWWA